MSTTPEQNTPEQNTANAVANITTANGSNLLTHSRLACAQLCLRKHFLRYELGIRREKTDAPLRIGSAYHGALECYDYGYSIEQVEQSVRMIYQDVPAWCEDTDAWLVEAETVCALFWGHAHYWQNDQLQVVATERLFDLQIFNPETGAATPLWRKGGKLDRVVRLPDGRVALQEYKTCSEDIGSESDYWRLLQIDTQISLYVLAARESAVIDNRPDYNVDTILYDVTRKPDIRPRKIEVLDEAGLKQVYDQATGERVYNKNGKPRESANAENGWLLVTRRETPAEYGQRLREDISSRPQHYYARREIPRLETDLLEYQHELWQRQQLLRYCQRNGVWPMNAKACNQMGKCEYFDICTQRMNVHGELPAGFVRVTELHPELAWPEPPAESAPAESADHPGSATRAESAECVESPQSETSEINNHEREN